MSGLSRAIVVATCVSAAVAIAVAAVLVVIALFARLVGPSETTAPAVPPVPESEQRGR